MSHNSQFSNTNPIYSATTTIECPNSGGHGTGFYFNHGGETYLITNKHVLQDKDEDGDVVYDPDSIQVFIREHPDMSQVSHFDIDLSGGEGTDWYSHPDHPDIDVAVVPMPRTLSPIGGDDIVTGSLAFSLNHFLSDSERIQGGDTAMIAGYPEMIAGTNSNLPVLRDALIASPYGVDFDDSPCFVIDTQMNLGTNGGPVFASPSSMNRAPNGKLITGGPRTALLGVHSATFRPDVENDTEKSLELNIVCYADLIPDIVTSSTR